MPEGEVELEQRGKQLAEELSEAQREGRRLRRRLADIDRVRAERVALVKMLETELARTAESRSYRYGHGLLSSFSRWVLGRPARASALEEARELLGDSRRELVSGGPLSTVPEVPAAERPPSEAASAPRLADPPPAAPVEAAGRTLAKLPVPKRRATEATAREERLREGFRTRYEALWRSDGAGVPPEAELSLPLPRDRRGMLVAAAADSEPDHPGADVVVCVHDAPEDVRTCLWSLLHSTTRPFHLIVVDDGSGPETAQMLDRWALAEPEIELIRNEGPDHGYTRAANIGLRASTGAHVILLNSDTVVSPGWLERIVACAESDEQIALVGPLSNAATHQSIPTVKKDGRWAVNEHPPWMTVDSTAMLLSGLSKRARPRVPFVNGFCYALTREAIDRVGLFDEERFGSGYCEENDFCIRARDAGFSAALADDAYVFHAKSKSYTSTGRDEVAQHNYQLFLKKHGEGRVKELLSELEEIPELEGLREAVTTATSGEQATINAFRAANPEPMTILFVLHGIPESPGGGIHSIYQETIGMRLLGVPAQIAIAADAIDRARAAYPDADEVFVPFDGEDELARAAETADVVVATHYVTMAPVKRLLERGLRFKPAYYVQDYEPFFIEPGAPQLAEALGSYTAIPGQLVFAKTHWLRNVVGQLHGVDVAKVEPSVDTGVYSAAGRTERGDGPLRVAAMIRPRTPRRQPVLTLDALAGLAGARGDAIEVTTFGCPEESIEALGRKSPGRHLGQLSREQVAEELRNTDVFLDASTYQAFGRTAVEAMACGCTVVVPRIGGAAQFVGHMENGLLVDTLDPGAVTGTLCLLADDPALTSTLQAAALEEAGRYSILRAALSEYTLFERENESFSSRSPATSIWPG